MKPHELGRKDGVHAQARHLQSDPVEPQVWIFQSNPKIYRLIDALQCLDRMQFLVNRYRDQIRVDDIVLLWLSGNEAGIYAQARVVERVDDRVSETQEASFWMDATGASDAKPRVVLAIERRFLGNPLLRTTIVKTEGLAKLMILRQPSGTNFRVDTAEWGRLRPLLPAEETMTPKREVLSEAAQRPRGGKLYGESCGELLERFASEAFSDGQEHSRDEITTWFATNHPLFKAITIQCHIEKYTTNFRSRVHYNATADHDLLFRVDEDWERLRLYRPSEDPAPIHGQPSTPKPSRGKSASTKGKRPSSVDRNRRLLKHIVEFGELTDGDLDDLGMEESDLADWLDSLLTRRPEAYVATPLFFHASGGADTPPAFTTRLAARFIGEHLLHRDLEPAPELETHVWSHFGRWHLVQPHLGDPKVHAYQNVPIRESRDVAASERLDLFAQLPAKVIGDLIREPDFLAEQQSWSADAASKAAEGPLSRQLRCGWQRPILLSDIEIIAAEDGQALLGEMRRADVVERAYVVSGLPLCARGEWEPTATLDREEAAERLLQHPVATAIVQFEVHRFFAGLSGEPAAGLNATEGLAQLELEGVPRGPLWRHVRTLLEQVGYWPVGTSTLDSAWVSAVDVTIKNLELLNVIERQGAGLRLTEGFQSRIKAHPAHPQNRGEKHYRVRLSQFLTTLQGGQA